MYVVGTLAPKIYRYRVYRVGAKIKSSRGAGAKIGPGVADA